MSPFRGITSWMLICAMIHPELHLGPVQFRRSLPMIVTVDSQGYIAQHAAFGLCWLHEYLLVFMLVLSAHSIADVMNELAKIHHDLQLYPTSIVFGFPCKARDFCHSTAAAGIRHGL